MCEMTLTRPGRRRLVSGVCAGRECAQRVCHTRMRLGLWALESGVSLCDSDDHRGRCRARAAPQEAQRHATRLERERDAVEQQVRVRLQQRIFHRKPYEQALSGLLAAHLM